MRLILVLVGLLACAGCNLTTDFDELYHSCPNHWTGDACDVCPGNWDAEADCNACRNQWTGADCEVCPDRWDASADCASCAGNWDLATDCVLCRGNWELDSGCTTCPPGLTDFDDDCGTCVRYVAAGSNPANSGLSWADATPAVQSGIVAATQAIANSGGNLTSCHVWMAAGTYNPTDGTGDTATFSLTDGVELYGGFPAGGGDWDTRDPEANVTTLDGGGLPDHVVTAAAGNVLDGLTVTGGHAGGVTGDDGRGAGLLVSAGTSIEVRQCTFSDLTAKLGGGGIYIDTGGIATVNDCSFSANTADGTGGAIWVMGTITVDRSLFSENQATYEGTGSGGAIGASTGSSVTLTDSTFTQNVAGSGGALRFVGSTAAVARCEFDANQAEAYNAKGGAIMVEAGSTVDIERSRFTDNTSWRGGALFVRTGETTLTATNCIFSGNQSGGGNLPDGGAVFVEGGAVSLDSCTVTNNSALDGGTGGLYVAGGTLAGHNTIVWANSPSGATDSGGLLTGWAEYCDLQDGTDHPDYNNRSVDPLFVGSGDLHLQSDSDCINKGDPADFPAVDFDGWPRTGQPDIGAYEYH